MFKIGDFSKLSRVSIKMLRNYDELDLFKPSYIDDTNGYRYYSASQIPRLNRILAFKELGFSLKEIELLLEKKLSLDETLVFLVEKRKNVLQTIKAEQEKASRIDAYVKILKQEDIIMKYDIVLKEMPMLKVIALRDTVSCYEEQGRLWKELTQYINDNHIKRMQYSYAVFYDTEYKEENVDVEVMTAVSNCTKGNDRVKYRELEPVKDMACTIHKGAYETITMAYNVLTVWMEDNGYEINGNFRSMYLKGHWNEPNPDEWITEIQVPVKKR